MSARRSIAAAAVALLVAAAPMLLQGQASGTGSSSSAAARQSVKASAVPPVIQPGKGTARSTQAKAGVSAVFSPARPGRPVTLYRKAGSKWVKAGSTKQKDGGIATFAFKLPSAATSYRVTAEKFQGLAPVTSSEVTTEEWWRKATFTDEFSGSRLGSDWSIRGTEYDPGSLRRCSKGDLKAVKVRRGTLQLSVLKDKSKGNKKCTAKRADGSVVGKYAYRLNGHVSTAGTQFFTYGYAAARIKFQERRGQHSSFWLQPQSVTSGKSAAQGGAEIDVIEWFGRDTPSGGLTSFVYYPRNNRPVKVGDWIKNPDYYLAGKSDEWWKSYHVFSVEWTKRGYVFRIDGQETWRTNKGVSGRPEYLILSLLSSDYELPNLGGDQRLPQTMNVDWVQFWQDPAA